MFSHQQSVLDETPFRRWCNFLNRFICVYPISLSDHLVSLKSHQYSLLVAIMPPPLGFSVMLMSWSACHMFSNKNIGYSESVHSVPPGIKNTSFHGSMLQLRIQHGQCAFAHLLESTVLIQLVDLGVRSTVHNKQTWSLPPASHRSNHICMVYLLRYLLTLQHTAEEQLE